MSVDDWDEKDWASGDMKMKTWAYDGSFFKSIHWKDINDIELLVVLDDTETIRSLVEHTPLPLTWVFA